MKYPGNKTQDLGDGITKAPLDSWKEVFPLLQSTIFTELPPEEREDGPSIHLPNYVWRGQREKFNGLLPSLYRGDHLKEYLTRAGDCHLHYKVIDHLVKFQYALRGRCNLDFRRIEEHTNDVWALGQEHGLDTPLLDWTTSPYVALYFAFNERRPKNKCRDEQNGTSCPPCRYLYGLNRDLIEQKVASLHKVRDHEKEFLGRYEEESEEAFAEVFEFITPLVHDNPHLISQNGLFTRLRAVRPIEDWVKDTFSGYVPTDSPLLYIIKIPDHSRRECLDFLNQWNINHLSLFPDIRGAALNRNRHFWHGIPGSTIP
ncbi:MAG: FRG domain-containing protein [Planctomycetes bacterium]|nr:FRG domain-containing protein [Planctomycetota bacterium]